MSQLTEPQQGASSLSAAGDPRRVCPFCGFIKPDAAPVCSHCTMEDSPVTRQATKARIGPWYVLQTRNPAAPGMKFSTLQALVKKGQIRPQSVVRGPTTHQLWKFAARVKGLSRELGLCYSCGGRIEITEERCCHCHKNQEPPQPADVLMETRTPLAGPVMRELPPVAQSADIILPIRKRPEAADSSHGPPPAQSVARKSPRTPEPASAPATEPQQADARPDRPAGGKILSAEELAAAFRLELNPAAREKGTGSSASSGTRRRRHPIRIGIILLLLVGLGAGGYVLYQDASLRDRCLDWARTKYAWGREFLGLTPSPIPQKVVDPRQSTHSQPPPKPPEPYRPSRVLAADPMGRSLDSVHAQPHAPAAPPAPVAEPLSNPVEPAARPKDDNPATAIPQPAAQPGKSPEPAPAVQKARVASPAPDEMKTAQSAEELQARAMHLYRQAIDAESRQDWAQAIHLLEEVKKLPASVRPINTDLKLKLYQQHLKN